MRVYVISNMIPNGRDSATVITYGLAKRPPTANTAAQQLELCLVRKEHPERIIPNPFTTGQKDILLRKGPSLVGTWQDEEVNILEDYQTAFGTNPPARARIAI